MPAVVIEPVLASLLGFSKTLAGMSGAEILNRSRALRQLDSRRLTLRQAPQIDPQLTRNKTVVSSKESLQLVRLALDHILGDSVDVPRSDKQKKDLYKATAGR